MLNKTSCMADLAQGATFDNVITMIQANALLTNRRRAYIDITRAAKHVKVFTDSADKTVLAWINHPSEKSSALDTLAKIQPDRTTHFDDKAPTPKAHKPPKTSSKRDEHTAIPESSLPQSPAPESAWTEEKGEQSL